ncbi:hypothetical protein G6F35_011936 [Rhizopus arrhizus]|nr:hypothetical protein G6F35_011936 [Rhizopus arrhizus]
MRVALAGASSSSLASPPPSWRHFHSFSYTARKAASAGDSVATLAGAAVAGGAARATAGADRAISRATARRVFTSTGSREGRPRSWHRPPPVAWYEGPACNAGMTGNRPQAGAPAPKARGRADR